MNAVVVEYPYAGKTSYDQPKTLYVSVLSAELFERWRELINDGDVDRVVLCNPSVCTGWRIRVDRKVSFHERPTSSAEDARLQEMAKYRVLQRDHMIPESVSPYNLIQEWVKHDDVFYPWRVLVTCTLLNKTSGRQVRPIFAELFEKYQTPGAVVEANRVDLVSILRPLGLQNVRANRLQQLSADFIQRIPLSKMRGVGRYAMDAYAIFCQGRIDLEPEDTWLAPYVEWRRDGGPPVEWPEEDFKEWWMAGSA
jgi:hypothetical protein